MAGMAFLANKNWRKIWPRNGLKSPKIAKKCLKLRSQPKIWRKIQKIGRDNIPRTLIFSMYDVSSSNFPFLFFSTTVVDDIGDVILSQLPKIKKKTQQTLLMSRGADGNTKRQLRTLCNMIFYASLFGKLLRRIEMTSLNRRRNKKSDTETGSCLLGWDFLQRFYTSNN